MRLLVRKVKSRALGTSSPSPSGPPPPRAAFSMSERSMPPARPGTTKINLDVVRSAAPVVHPAVCQSERETQREPEREKWRGESKIGRVGGRWQTCGHRVALLIEELHAGVWLAEGLLPLKQCGRTLRLEVDRRQELRHLAALWLSASLSVSLSWCLCLRLPRGRLVLSLADGLPDQQTRQSVESAVGVSDRCPFIGPCCLEIVALSSDGC